jgi:hypothetical protein
VDELGQLDAGAARHAIAALEWSPELARSGRSQVLVKLPTNTRTQPGPFLQDLADAIRCYPRVIFEGDPATANGWELAYHRIAAGVTLLDLVLFVDDLTATMDGLAACDWLRSELVHRRLVTARSVAVDLPEWRRLEVHGRVLATLGQCIARAVGARRGRDLPVRFYGLSARDWSTAYRSGGAER